MVVLKDNPQGVDKAIQALQVLLYEYLSAAWEVSDYMCYGRCYRNQTKDGYVPEVFIGGKDYKENFLDDRLSAISFFGYEKNTMGLVNKAEVHLIFCVNTKTLKAGISHRADEEVRSDVERALGQFLYGTTITTLIGLQRVFQEYNGWNRNESMKYRDMHPHHCFRINFQLAYEINNNC